MSSPNTSTGSEIDALGLVTAAGESTRMGGFPKPLLCFDGQRFVERITDQYELAGVSDILVVLGHEAAAVRAATDLEEATVVVNDTYQDGMLSSVKLGVEHAIASDRSAMFLWPVDFPCVTAETVRSLWSAYDEHDTDIVLPQVEGEGGHPALFCHTTFESLLNAPQDEGARAVVYDPDTTVTAVDVNDPRILVDIDRPSEYWEAVKRYEIGGR